MFAETDADGTTTLSAKDDRRYRGGAGPSTTRRGQFCWRTLRSAGDAFPADLIGYVDGGLDADLGRWFPDAEPVVVPDRTRSVTSFLARLAPTDAAALAALDARVRSGVMPQFLDVFVWSFLRYRAVRAGRLDVDAVEADFRALGQDGALEPQLGLLRLMSRS